MPLAKTSQDTHPVPPIAPPMNPVPWQICVKSLVGEPACLQDTRISLPPSVNPLSLPTAWQARLHGQHAAEAAREHARSTGLAQRQHQVDLLQHVAHLRPPHPLAPQPSAPRHSLPVILLMQHTPALSCSWHPGHSLWHTLGRKCGPDLHLCRCIDHAHSLCAAPPSLHFRDGQRRRSAEALPW